MRTTVPSPESAVTGCFAMPCCSGVKGGLLGPGWGLVGDGNAQSRPIRPQKPCGWVGRPSLGAGPAGPQAG